MMLTKPRQRFSAFFFCRLATFILLSLSSQASWSVVRCASFDRLEHVSRNQIISSGSGRQRTVALAQPKAGAIVINSTVDLNISPDIAALAHGMVSETTARIWLVNARQIDNLSGYITAEYQFNDPIGGINRICDPTGASCILVTNISPANTYIRRFGINTDPNNIIRIYQEAIQFNMDLTQLTLSGRYEGHLEITLSIGPNADGSNSTDLICN